MIPFVLVATQRSGTNFFRSVVNQHPQIHCCDELFLDSGWRDQPDNFYHYWLQRLKTEPQLITSRGSATAIAGFMKAVYGAFGQYGAVGIDIKYTELERLYHLPNVILAHGWRTVHIVRRNILKAQISHFLLNTRKGYIEPKGYKGCIDQVGDKQVHIEPNENFIELLQSSADEIERWRKRFSRGPYLEVAYEDFFAPGASQGATIQPQVLQRVFAFLEVDFVPASRLKSARKKGNPSSLRRLIENYDEVADALADTRWESLLH